MSFIPAELIKKKRRGENHSAEEIKFLIDHYVSGDLPDYQMAAWCMAVCFQGMSPDEIASFTLQMKNSGHTFDFDDLPSRVDKHSTGGVGDKTSMILAPIAAAAGCKVPMIAGRGLGHTGGTLDKLESLLGFNVRLTEKEFHDLVVEHGLAIMGQTEDICPADRKLYSLRDVTGTIDSLPLICGSIMSKKLAEDLTGLVLDVKFGSGAFMKSLEDAEMLAQLLKNTGELNGVKVTALLTNMNQPLGRFIGNGLEMKECLDILSGESLIENGIDFYNDTRELSLILAGHMIYLADKVDSAKAGYAFACEILKSGKALEEFRQLCRRQGCNNISLPQPAQFKEPIICTKKGKITAMDCEKIGLASLELGAGRQKSSDKIDHSAGIEMACRLGNTVEKGDTLGYLFSNDRDSLNEAQKLFNQALSINDDQNIPVAPSDLIAKVLE